MSSSDTREKSLAEKRNYIVVFFFKCKNFNDKEILDHKLKAV